VGHGFLSTRRKNGASKEVTIELRQRMEAQPDVEH
jgi:hypothetical protein